MLDLETPLTLGGKSYEVMVGGIRGEWNLHSRRIEVYVGPGRKHGEKVRIGTRETDDEKRRVLAPPLLSTLTIQDSIPSDPAYTVVFQKLQDLIEAIEAVVVTHPDLQEQVYQSGEEEFPLACTFQPYALDAFQFEEREKPVRGDGETPVRGGKS